MHQPIPPDASSPLSHDFEAVVPLLPAFRFAHEPVRPENATRFVGREAELATLVERIIFSEGGSFLVTGYRGVGKTSFVKQVLRRLRESVLWAASLLGETDKIRATIWSLQKQGRGFLRSLVLLMESMCTSKTQALNNSKFL